ncbi:hypothetical protein BDW59DRAFT_147932, partial [Aspergillus cavernicola]
MRLCELRVFIRNGAKMLSHLPGGEADFARENDSHPNQHLSLSPFDRLGPALRFRGYIILSDPHHFVGGDAIY